MKRLVPCLLLVLVPAFGQDTGSRVTIEQLQSRIRLAQDSTELDSTTRTRITSLCQQAIVNIEAADAHAGATERLRAAGRSAPAAAVAIRAAIDKRRSADPAVDLDLSPSDSVEHLEQIFEEELARLGAVEGRLAMVDVTLYRESRRPDEARQRIRAAFRAAESLQTQGDGPAGDHPWLAEARRWAVGTRMRAIENEIAMLNHELRSHSARSRLLRAQRDEAVLTISWISQRIALARRALSERRAVEAKAVIDSAQAILDGASGSDPTVEEVATANRALGELLLEQTRRVEQVSEREVATRFTVPEIARLFRETRRKLRLEGTSEPLGLSIRESRRQVPNPDQYKADRRELQREIGIVSLRLARFTEERSKISNRAAYLEERIDRSGAMPDAGTRSLLQALTEERASLLERVLDKDVTLRRHLFALDEVLRQLVEGTEDFDAYLAEHLLWVRSTDPVGITTFAAVPEELGVYFSGHSWFESLRIAGRALAGPPGVLLVLGLFLGVIRRRIRAVETGRARNVGRVRVDRFIDTFVALVATLLRALPIPLALAAIGWAMRASGEATAFSEGTGTALMRASIALVVFLWPRTICEPDGVAKRHFNMHEQTVADLRSVCGWAVCVMAPLYFISESAAELGPAQHGGATGQLGSAALALATAAFLVQLVHPTRGAARRVLAENRDSLWWRWRYAWLLLVLAVPLTALLLAVAGYTHSDDEVIARMHETAWLALFAWLAFQLAKRWLLVTQRRIRFETALKAHEERLKQQSASADEQAALSDEIAGHKVDLAALDANSRKLLQLGVAFATLIGLAGIWASMIPALRVVGDVPLWSRAMIVEGTEQPVPVTLTDLTYAVVIAIVGFVAARNLPSLLDILMIKRGRTGAGGRYAITTLTSYTIVAIATMMTLGKLGASWGQLGFAAAALGVGIGFGLQEIVANFACGLILLFEQPVRVGDVITIGDVSGTVTKIRIRATTIRDFDRKELVVPNKDLITRQLSNWSLTDSILRVTVPVGIAYGSDVELAMRLMLESVREHEKILEDPEPSVRFRSFGQNSLDFEVRGFVGAVGDRVSTITDLHRAIDRGFRDAGVVIAFPQLDVHHHNAQAAPETGR